MSRVYFHSPDGEAELRGSERAYAGCLVSDLSLGVMGSELDDYPSRPSVLRKVVNPRWYGIQGDSFTRDFPVAFRVSLNQGDDLHFVVDGEKVGAWVIQLNTALAIGNGQVKLLARIHGQCEIHCYVRGENRKWLAEIIDEGRSTSVFRRNQGWEGVSQFLKQSDSDPVAMSYSVCEQFPNQDVAGWEDDNDGDNWYDLPDKRRWELAWNALAESQQGLELSPEDWNTFRFAPVKWDAFTLLEYCHAEQEK